MCGDDYRRRRSNSPYSRRHDEEDAEAVTDTFVRTVAAEVKGNDVKYEANLKERERNNPKYGFLTNKHARQVSSSTNILLKF